DIVDRLLLRNWLVALEPRTHELKGLDRLGCVHVTMEGDAVLGDAQVGRRTLRAGRAAYDASLIVAEVDTLAPAQPIHADIAAGVLLYRLAPVGQRFIHRPALEGVGRLDARRIGH